MGWKWNHQSICLGRVSKYSCALLATPVPQVVSPDTVKVVHGEGMPISKSVRAKGDLKIKFKIEFPFSLSAAQSQAVRKALVGV